MNKKKKKKNFLYSLSLSLALVYSLGRLLGPQKPSYNIGAFIAQQWWT